MSDDAGSPQPSSVPSSPSGARLSNELITEDAPLVELETLLREPWLPRPEILQSELASVSSVGDVAMRRIDEFRQLAQTTSADAQAMRAAVSLLVEKAAQLEKVFAMVDSVESIVHMMKTSVIQMEENVETAEKATSIFSVPGFFSALTKKKSEDVVTMKPSACILNTELLFDRLRLQYGPASPQPAPATTAATAPSATTAAAATLPPQQDPQPQL